MTHALFQRLCGGSRLRIKVKNTSTPAAKRKTLLQVEALEERAVPTGTWATLANPIPADGGGTMLLLSDGSVMVQGGSVGRVGIATSTWYKLTPDATGSYLQGTWSQLASMGIARSAYASNVLTNGRVFVLGGEFSGPNSTANWTNTGEIYDPVANAWTASAKFPVSLFGDDPTEVLSNGDVFAGYLSGPETYLYDPIRNSWTPTGSKLRQDQSDEETWMKLPDDSILSYDIFASYRDHRFEAQRFIPAKDEWVDASNLDPNNPPHILSEPSDGYELGPAGLMANGNAIFFGANGNTAVYNPSTNTWTAGPPEPMVMLNGKETQLVMADAPGTVLPNGDILLALSPLGSIASNGNYTFLAPTWIYEFSPATNSYTDVTPADFLANTSSVNTTLLVLPTGQALLTNYSGQMELFTPDGSPDPAWQPRINNITNDGNNVFTLTGTQLNGISEGGSYGDDVENASNYPIIRFTDANGNVSYARTSNWSSTGVATGSTPESVEFSLPAGITPGPYLVSVVANGIASAPVLDVMTGAVDTKLALQLDANTPTNLDVLNNGNMLGQFPASSLSSIFLFGGDAKDTITLDNSLTTLNGVPVTVSGGVTDSLVLDDRGFTSPRTFMVTASGIAWGGSTVNYSGIGQMTINGGSGGNTFNMLATSAATLLTLAGGGNGNNNTLAGSNAGNAFILAGRNAGTLAGNAYASSVIFRSIGNLTAGSGGDTFQFGGTLSGSITGGGSDTLDYSNYPGNVIVDLQTGSATGVGGTVSGIAKVLGATDTGSNQRLYNLLIGNGGNTLVGGFGRDNILVAGARPSTLVGGNMQDLLIGGSTTYDTEAGLTSWKQIANFWVANTSLSLLVTKLTSGTGVPILDASVVTGNGGGNSFVGEEEIALFYTDGMDSMGGFNTLSQQITISP